MSGINLIGQKTALAADASMRVEDARLPYLDHIRCEAVIWPDSTDGFNNVPYWQFKGESGTVYNRSFRHFTSVAEPGAGTETPSRVVQAAGTELYAAPNTAAYQLTAVDVVCVATLDLWKLTNEGIYRALGMFSVGPADTAAGKLPVFGTVWGNFKSATPSAGIDKIDIFLGAAGKMGAGSSLAVYGLDEAIAGGDLYSTDERPTRRFWLDGSQIYTKTIDLFDGPSPISALPSPGASLTVAHGISGLRLETAHIVKGWMRKSDASIVVPIPDGLGDGMGWEITSTGINLVVPSTTTRDFSLFNKAYLVLEYCKS